MPKPNTLSRTAQAVLADAAAHDDHLAFPPKHLATAARRAVVQSLLNTNMLEEIAADDDDAAWRTTESGERLALRVTEAGLAAVGSEVTQGGTTDSDVPVDEPAPTSISENRPSSGSPPTPDATAVKPATVVRHGLRTAAEAVLASWDDPDGNRPALPGAIEGLRAVLAAKGRRSPALPGAPRLPRPETKRATVLTLLRRPEGASVAQVTDATGWAPHTVRGFFAGLKKAGTPVDVLERVRQVGPGKEGAKGSYTVYRVTEAP